VLGSEEGPFGRGAVSDPPGAASAQSLREARWRPFGLPGSEGAAGPTAAVLAPSVPQTTGRAGRYLPPKRQGVSALSSFRAVPKAPS
jgi:hypothetical protein